MRTFDNGCFFSVTCTCDDVERFANMWPCSGFRYGDTVWFQFDKQNGDLVDLEYRNTGRPADDSRVDGGAIVALSQDAQRYGAKRLGVPAAMPVEA